MKIRVFLETIEELLNESKEEWDTFWAYRLCQQTRFVVQKIFESFPDVSEVEDLLKTLEHCPEKVKNAKNEGPYKGHLDEFADSMNKRLDEMRTYVAEMNAPLQERPEVSSTSKGIGQRIFQRIHKVNIPTASHKSG